MNETDQELDQLVVRVLELSQELIETKLKLEQLTKEGYILMAQARYANGAKTVSADQIPAEGEFEANFRVDKQECLRQEETVRFHYYSKHEKGPNDPDQGLKHRKEQVQKIQETSEKNHDPLKWFGVLVPQALRKSAKCFERSLELTLETANLQSEIQGLEARQKYLRRQKTKSQN